MCHCEHNDMVCAMLLTHGQLTCHRVLRGRFVMQLPYDDAQLLIAAKHGCQSFASDTAPSR